VPTTQQAQLKENDPHNQGLSFEVFRERFLFTFNSGSDAHSFKALHPSIVSAMNTDQDAFLQSTHRQIIEDPTAIARTGRRRRDG
jgi:hypothetical protein